MKTNLKVNIAKDEYGHDLVIDIGVLKNLFIAGMSGSGKSTILHNIISTLIANNNPNELKLILIDPKRIELSVYTSVPHLLTPTIIDPKKAVLVLKWSAKEIGRRLDTLKNNNCKDINAYHRDVLGHAIEKFNKRVKSDEEDHFSTSTLPETMPNMVIVIDDLSNLLQTYPKETISTILQVIELGHSVGVYFIFTSTRVGQKIFGKELQSAMGARIALQMSATADSRLVMGTTDACQLHDPGDMLFRDGKKYIVRGQVNMFTYEEAQSIAKTVYDQYKDEITDSINFGSPTAGASAVFDALNRESLEDNDDMYEPAKEFVVSRGKASTSFIQRGLGIGYSRAAKLMDLLEDRGVIGPANGSEPRKVMGQDTADQDDNEIYEKVRKLVISSGQVSSSFIHDKIGIGYSRAVLMMAKLEREGVIGPASSNKPRKVLVAKE